MPENEFGERIHNFFGQEGLSQDQHQFQSVDGSWSGFSNGLVSNQRQINASLTANVNSYLTQQSVDPERGQSSNLQHGMNFIQKPMRSEYARSVMQEHQQLTNGYMHGNLGSQTSLNEANDMRGSPVNYDLFGGQQQLNTQQPGMLQPFPRQQMTFNDMQLLKHQAMVKQMHEYQMQQQLQKQQLEARQLNSLKLNAVNGSRSIDNQSHPLIGGVPLKDASHNWLQPDLMKGNTNWMHRGMSPVIQGSSSGSMVTPGNGQLNLLAQECEPSLYGMPVSGTNAPQNAFSFLQMNRVAAQNGSANRSSSITNQGTSFLNEADVQGSQILPRSTYQEKVLFSNTIDPGSNNGSSFENFRQDDSQQQNISGQEKFCQMEGAGLSEKSSMKVPENMNTLPKSTTLDPTEEKILFGSDDNLWEAFGNSTDMSWSALMESAVAETCSNDTGVFDLDSKQQSLWANNNTPPFANSHIGNRAQDSGVKASNALNDKIHGDSTGSTIHHFQDKGTDHTLFEKPMTQHSQMTGNMFHSLSSGVDVQNNMHSIGKNEDTNDRPGNWKAACNPNTAARMEQKNHFTQNLKMQWPSYGAGNDSSASRDVQENTLRPFSNNSVEKGIQQLKSGEGSQILQSYASNNVGKVMAESNEMGNSGKENSSDSFRSKFSPESLAHVNPHDLSVLPGGGETRSPSIGLVMDGLNHKESTNHMLLFGQTVSQSFSNKNHAASAGADHQQISSQIAPSRYSQYEAFKNRLVQPVNDTGRSTLRIGEQDSNVGNSVDGLHSIQLSKQLNTVDPGDIVPMQQMSSTPGAETLSSASLHHSKQQSLWANNNTSPHANYRIGNMAQDSGVKASNALSDKVHGDSTGSTIHHLQDKGTDHSLFEKPMTQHSQMTGNMFHSLSSGVDVQNNSHSIGKNEDTNNRPGNWKAACNPSSAALMEQKNHFTQNLKMQWPSYGAGNDSSAYRDVQENTQRPFSNNSVEKAIHQLKSGEGSQILQSYASNNVGKVVAESYEMGNSRKENSSDSFRSKFSPESLAQVNAHDLSVLPGGKETQSPSIGLVMDGLNHRESTNHMLHLGQTVSQSFSDKDHPASAGADHQQINSQIAPSSYSQFEAFKNRLGQPVNDTGKSSLLKIGEQHTNVWNSVDGLNSIQLSKQLNTADPGCIVPIQQMSSTPGAETLSSVSLPHISTDQLLKVDKPKKRKTATSELISWDKEIMQGSKRLKTLGEAEVDWARAANRFTEKVEFATSLEDGSSIRSKKRLIYTTQLVQQLFSPPPGRVISVVASSNYECVAYTVGRTALGDGCSSCCAGTKDGFSPPNNSYPLSEKSKTEKINDQYISKAAEDFISRTKKLETDFTGLENGTTITDLRVEVQDLERFGVINRFASFHQSSSSMDRTVSSVRVNPQRYVTIAPMPRHIPDMVHCLSL